MLNRSYVKHFTKFPGDGDLTRELVFYNCSKLRGLPVSTSVSAHKFLHTVRTLCETSSGTGFLGHEVVSTIAIALPKLDWVVQEVTSSCSD